MAFLFDSVLLNIIVVFASLFMMLYLYFVRNFSFWKKHGIPYAKPLPFVGNLKEAILQTMDIGHNLKKIYDAHKDKPYVGFFSFDHPSLLINDPDLVKCILVKDAHNFLNRVQTADEKADPLTAKAVFALKDAKWKHIRLSMTPIFTTGKLKKMLDLVDSCAKKLTLYLDEKTADGSPLDVKDTMDRYTIDVISSCAFGIESNTFTNPEAEFRVYLRKFVEYTALKSLATVLISFAPNYQSFFKLQILEGCIVGFLRKTVWSTVQYREKNNVDRKDFLDVMMELRKKGQNTDNGKAGVKFDGDDFVAQCYAFLLAGFETSATTLAFALYELSLQPDIQHTLREEIAQTLKEHDQQVTYEGIQKMQYLDMVVSETLRKYPVVSFLERKCMNDYKLPPSPYNDNAKLEGGIGVYIPVYGIHHDPQYYPEPNRFDPERFTEENIRKRPQYTHLPFGAGPRICLGIRFGLMQIKTGLINILSQFEVAPSKGTPVQLKLDPKPFLMKSQGDIPLIFNKI
ncbi:cytochrome P450 6j1-like [Zootermopsis nevadensis]|uniref:cytochrome P450 6j1-like n=1 Tax=Zootermopsis nevadensis TaxID=136037 RepID=UPI000B8E4A99|nr:cytochrome P450 6j1-like [Zootermopsis nevadensis]